MFTKGRDYAHSQPLNFGFTGLKVFGNGCVLRHIGTAAGASVMIDAGATSINYGHEFGGFLIFGNGVTDSDGLLVRNVVHASRYDIKVRNIERTAFDIRGDVLSTYDSCVCSYANSGGPTEAKPRTVFRLDGTPGAITATTACVFTNCIAETAREVGWNLATAQNNKFIGGTSEGLDGVGLVISTQSTGNSFGSFFMEFNGQGDVICRGSDNRFQDIAATSRAVNPPYEAVRSIILKGSAANNVFSGGRGAYAIEIETGATSNRFENLQCWRIIDGGTATIIANCQQDFNSLTRYSGTTLGNVNNPDPKALDWYEEGTFAPAAAGNSSPGAPTYAVRSGHYTRVGRMIVFSLTLSWTGQDGAGDLQFPGLPFPARPGGPIALSISASSLARSAGQLVAEIAEEGTVIVPYVMDTATSRVRITVPAIGSVTISGTYEV